MGSQISTSKEDFEIVTALKNEKAQLLEDNNALYTQIISLERELDATRSQLMDVELAKKTYKDENFTYSREIADLRKELDNRNKALMELNKFIS